MFMDRNRALNGAASPGATASSDAAEQRAAEQLIPNEPLPTSVPSRLWKPRLQSSAAINAMHYKAGLTDEANAPYTENIPHVGGPIPSAEGDRALKMR